MFLPIGLPNAKLRVVADLPVEGKEPTIEGVQLLDLGELRRCHVDRILGLDPVLPDELLGCLRDESRGVDDREVFVLEESPDLGTARLGQGGFPSNPQNLGEHDGRQDNLDMPFLGGIENPRAGLAAAGLILQEGQARIGIPGTPENGHQDPRIPRISAKVGSWVSSGSTVTFPSTVFTSML